MAQLHDRTGDLLAFVAVIDAGSMSAAAATLGAAPSSMSRAVSRLEARVGARLIRRTTRRLDLTPEGERFYDRVVRILGDLEEAESDIREGARKPRGRIRVNAPVPFALHQLVPRLAHLTERHPELEVDISMTDALVDLLEERADVAIRIGPLKDSSMFVRPIATSSMHLVASPSYLKARGVPRTLDELERLHDAVRFALHRSLNEWRLLEKKNHTRVLRLPGRVAADNGEGVRQLVLRGHGIARLSAFMIERDLKSGQLVEILPKANPGDVQQINAVYTERAENSARILAFLDFLKREFEPGTWSTA
jgi:DNA-binding transcriptional LysR family regulator